MLKYFWSTVAFIFISQIVFGQNNLDQKVNLNYKNQSIQYILTDIEKEYQVFFSYGNIDLSNKVSFGFRGKLRKALNRLLFPNDIEYKLIGDNIVLKNKIPQKQNIKGLIIDLDTQLPQIGANIYVLNSSPLIGTNADENGYFILPDLPLGRYDIQVQYLGFEAVTINQVLLSAGKEAFLNIEMKEARVTMNEVVVTAEMNRDISSPINDMASVSAHSFTVDETQRFAAAISDPARMVQSYAGVSNSGDDLSNEIIIRGNNARGLLWKLEGIEVFNPNHFGGYISGGGAISILSSNILANSDFYTGAFPAEYGNALSGVFDLKIRNGNKDKREHSIAFGTLGLEASTEGYFSKKSNASYLINYRYSSLNIIDNFLVSLGGDVPSYRDLTFKVNLPTKNAGTFSFFGIDGSNRIFQVAPRDSSTWKNLNDELDGNEEQRIRIGGINHRISLNEKSYLKTNIATSIHNYKDLTSHIFHQDEFEPEAIDKTDFSTYNYRASLLYNYKKNSQHQFRLGAIYSYENFDFNFQAWIPDSFATSIPKGADDSLTSFFGNKGHVSSLQSFFQWQNRFKKNWELNTGFHFSYFFLNNTFAIDPRLAISWRFRPNQKISFATGFHSRFEHTSTYFVQPSTADEANPFPNINLKMPRAFHIVLGYDRYFWKNYRIKIEGYYQYLFNIPVSSDPNSAFSTLNSDNIFDFIFANNRGRSSLVSEGKGVNFGLDFTLERKFQQNYYILVTASIFDSRYTTLDNRSFRSINANNLLFNALAGKEWKFSMDKKSFFGINGKFTVYGGNRVTPVDIASSQIAGRELIFPNAYFTKKLPPYLRFDFGVSYKFNRKMSTHSFNFDFQNLSNRRNSLGENYDENTGVVKDILQNGLIPFITYKVDFSFNKKQNERNTNN